MTTEPAKRPRRRRPDSRRSDSRRTDSRRRRSSSASKKPERKEMLINMAQPEESRIAVIEDGQLEELYMERASQDNYVGNIYKGKIVNLEPSIQAVFVDFGVGRNGFLHISDVEPQYFRQGGYDPDKPIRPERERSGRNGNRDAKNEGDGDGEGNDRRPQRGRRRPRPGDRPREKPPIQEIFRRGDEVLVQVIKEGIGNKGPTLSTYISIPGRYLVLMPALGRVGVSRKIEDEDARRRLRSIMLDLNPPKGLGFIVRTAGIERTRRELARDMAYLMRLWKVIAKRIATEKGPVDIYEENDMMIRTIRDIFSSDVDSIVVDEASAYQRAKEFLELVMPKFADRLKLHDEPQPLFSAYNLDESISQINKREVPLKKGGSIVIDSTEALVAIDVNSGSFRTDGTAEETAYQLNMSAAEEIARQLRLRDLGGVIVNDFIDMRQERHRRDVENCLRDSVRRDRARTKILRTSPFGLIEMTRQRIRPSLGRAVFQECPCCVGKGIVKTAESMSIEVIRKLMLVHDKQQVARLTVRVNDEVAAYLNNKKRRELASLEDAGDVTIQVLGSEGKFPEFLQITCFDSDEREVPIEAISS